jgi:uncharacterized protein (UPF0264 family)
MTGLLVSVRNGDEARLAIEAGVDVLDVKEPARGSLGAADAATIAEIAGIAAGRAPLSVALGELITLADDELTSFPAEGVRYAKLGLSRCAGHNWATRWVAWAEALPQGTSPVAVVYADASIAGSPPEEEILPVAARHGAAAVLVDTFAKQAGSLLTHWNADRLERFLASARQVSLPVVLAGSLSLPQIIELLPLDPWLVAVRGAACRAGRESPLDFDRLRQLVEAVHTNRRPGATAAMQAS